MSVRIQLELPDALIQQARNMGLLESRRLADLVVDEVRRRNSGQVLKSVLDEIRSTPGEPVTMEEINAEIKAGRRAREARS